MTTLSEFRSNLREMGNFAPDDTRITDAVILREINRALKRIAMLHDWPWLQAERLLVCVADTVAIPFPADFLRLISLRFDGESNFVPQRSIQEVDLVKGSGRPAAFAIWGGKIILGPAPAGGEQLRLRYITQESVLVNDSDAPLIPDYWDDGVYDAALVELHRQVKQLDESGLAEARFQTWVTETRDNANQSRQPIRVRVRAGSQI